MECFIEYNQVQIKDERIENSKVFWFDKSAKISTYLYAIVAGPYGHFEKNVEGMPPMRIYARKSVMDDVEYEDMFLAT
mgnify:CR=1 FL=1